MALVKVGDTVESSLKDGEIKNYYRVVSVDEAAGMFTYEITLKTKLRVGWDVDSTERNVSPLSEIGKSLKVVQSL